MYKQTINQIKVAIIPLDGIVFDLNRYRYNYYHHLCDSKNVALDKHDFYAHLSNMYDMYKDLPLHRLMDESPLNAQIERELSEYLTHKGLKPKEGFLELLEYLRQKGIQIAIMSTHRTKDAVHYLQITKLYHKVHFIIGSDTSSLPLPSTQILETIQNHFQVQSHEVLVFSPFMSLNHAANKLKMNVLYCEDLVTAGEEEKKTSYKCVKNVFEALNVLLFDQYEEVQMYSPILGMNSDMSYDELEQVHDKLQETYQDDPEIMNLVDQTYAYHISQINEQVPQKEVSLPKDEPVLEKEPVFLTRKFTFDDEDDEEIIETEKEVIEDIESEIKPDQNRHEHISALNEQEENELTMLLQQINKPKESTIKTVTDFKTIQEIVESSIEEEEEEIEEADEEEISLFSSFMSSFLNIIATSFLIVFMGLIIYVAFIHQFDEGNAVCRMLSVMFNVYYHFIEMIFASLFDALHQFISFVPLYKDYVNANPMLSPMGVCLVNIFVFQIIVMGIINIIIFIVSRRKYETIDE